MRPVCLRCTDCPTVFRVKPGDFRLRHPYPECPSCFHERRGGDIHERRGGDIRRRRGGDIRRRTSREAGRASRSRSRSGRRVILSRPKPSPVTEIHSRPEPAPVTCCLSCENIIRKPDPELQRCGACVKSFVWKMVWKTELIEDRFRAKLESLLHEYASGYEKLREEEKLTLSRDSRDPLSILNTGYDPYKDINMKTESDTKWMKEIGHVNYRRTLTDDDWEPLKVLEWGTTLLMNENSVMWKEANDIHNKKHDIRVSELQEHLHALYKEIVDRFEDIIVLQLQRCFDDVKPHTKILIDRELDTKYMTRCINIVRIFKPIFVKLREKDADFHTEFEFNNQTPINERVEKACWYYMRHRGDLDKEGGKRESVDARDRRDTVRRMIFLLRDAGEVTAHFSENNRDMILRKSDGIDENDATFANTESRHVLFENPDEGAVHVFVPPEAIAGYPPLAHPPSPEEHRERIFFTFRDFNEHVSQPVDKKERKFARFYDTEGLRHPKEESVKASRAFNNLWRLPEEMQFALTGKGKDLTEEQQNLRPSLNAYLGYRQKFMHLNTKLPHAIFVKGLGLNPTLVEETEKQAWVDIQEARAKMERLLQEAKEKMERNHTARNSNSGS